MQETAEDAPETTTYITKLSMKGFKSFQRRTAIPFYEGLTAIVGRNGSGKSNIIDALSFVMGQRSSNLRAEKLEQLIFNGGDERKPADEAIVTLHLDNEAGTFDEFLEDDDDTDEITIGRKITRNGYSTYRFNETNCKRSKIDQILDTAGINPDGFHFVRQGEIKDIINRTPTQRRKIIDRISGIASYEDKREQAEDELDEVDERLQELRIKQEMKKDRLDQLREQKEAAEQYQDLEEKKDRLSYSILKMRKRELTSQLEGLEESEKKQRIDELEEKVDELDEELQQLQDRKEEIQDEIEAGQDTNIIQEIERIKGKIERKKDKIENKRD
ncbi:MAG: AAA family ATPase, partial [Candidatus Nanohaloarchaeota archaeon QJJ-5]|nr:AAA family ATPase [Candidatus Nanohaloarchaeota archaeon QJJ-5]